MRRAGRVFASASALRWWQPVALAALVVLAYGNGLSGPFIFDDQLTVVENRQIRDLSSLRALLAPERELPVAGRPIANISFALNYAAHGLDVRGYRVANVAIHLLCGLFVLGIVGRTLSTPVCGPWLESRASAVAFAAASLWIVHPLNSEAVSYLTQRTELLMGLCYLGTLYCAIRSAGARHRGLWVTAALVACAAGMGSKESMVTVPVIVVLYDRIFLFRSFREAAMARRGIYAGLFATWVILAALQLTGPRIHSAGFSSGVGVWTYLLNQTIMIVRYLRLSIWPDALVLNYGVPLDLTLRHVWPQALLVLALAAMSTIALARLPPLGFLGAWFFITLAPASSIVPVATEVGAERRMYLPLLALVVAASAGGLRLIVALVRRTRGEIPGEADRIVDRRAEGPERTVAATALVLALGACVFATRSRNQEFRSPLVLAQTAFERWPTPVAHHMVATELSLAGREEESLRELRESVKGYPRGYYDLGVGLFRQRQFAEAITAFETFVARYPALLEVVEARVLAGRALAELEKWPEAIAAFQDALRMRPSRTDVHGPLADALVRVGRGEEAIPHYRRFLVTAPGDAGALGSLGVLLAERDQTTEAADLFRRAVAADPANGGGHRNLSGTLLALGDVSGAIDHAREAATLSPSDALAHDLLGVALMNARRASEAVPAFERAAHLAPADEEVKRHLDAARVIAQANAGR
jgi:protein O-mannosyl-transferase